MGCTSSRTAEEDEPISLRPSRRRHTSGPREHAQNREWTPPGQPITLDPNYRPSPADRVPYPRRGSDGREVHGQQPMVEREGLLRALSTAAEYLGSRNTHYTIIALGGVLYTVLLQTRRATEDVDFFFSDLAVRPEDARTMEQAGRYAVERIGSDRLGDNWLNNQIVNFIPRALWPTLVQRARRQNTVVFQSPGLTVLAAPWSYCYTSKAERLLQSNYKSHDIPDAAHYLRQYVLAHGNKPLSLQLIHQWAAEYGRHTSNHVTREINTVYRDLFRSDAIRDFKGTADFRPFQSDS
ncbi:MAG: hypothetical protein M1817_006633 [Caeruleum heppii]|nr:MAG: hypothetical protein M1817_006633 [Caeruleum heppii]